MRLLVLSFVAALLSAAANGQTPLQTIRVGSGFSSPLQAVSPNGDEDRLFVVEQRSGRIRILDLATGQILPNPFVTVTVFSQANEQGLLGLAFHPDFAQNGYFYVNYTRPPDGATVVDRYQVSAVDPNVADPTSATTILGPITQPFANHNGGDLKFGPDGYLYIGLGDGGSAGDPGCRAQNPGVRLGKMLRIDVDSVSPFAIPPDNPFVNDPGVLNIIWAIGLRNPWRFSFDRLTGDLYIADVGQNNIEEICFQAGSSPGGENYGWKVMEGLNCFGTSNCNMPAPCGSPTYTDPIHTYNHVGGRCSVTGGYVYRGCAVPDLQGTYFFGDFCSGEIWSFRTDGINLSEFQDRTAELAPVGGGTINQITSFGEDGKGELYIVDRDGEVFRIVSALPSQATDLGSGKPGSNGRAPQLELCGSVAAGSFAELRLRSTPPNTIAVLVYAMAAAPMPLWQGTLVPRLDFVIPHQTDALGKTRELIPGGLGPFAGYFQFLVADPGATANTAFSNALQVDFP